MGYFGFLFLSIRSRSCCF